MATNMSFGEVLREARERSGLDLQTAGNRLRIRADILKAIEDGDFSRMPQSGYTRNMISAYARLVGLNPNEITHMYLDELNAYQTGRMRQGSMRIRNINDAYSSSTGSSRRSSNAQTRSGRSSRGGASSVPQRNGRALYEDRTIPASRTSRVNDRVHPSRQSLGQSSQYTNLYAPPSNVHISGSKLPIIIAGAVILILLIIVLVLLLGNKGGATTTQQETPTVPITGLTDTSNNATTDATSDGTDTTTSTTATAPTKATFAYSVASGGEAYIEIYEGDSGTATVAKTVSGPAQQSFDVTSTLRFVSDATSAVTVTVDGQAITLEENSNGMYDYTLDFSEVLATWQSEHGDAQSTSASSQASSTTSSSTTSSSAATTSNTTSSSASTSSN